MNITPIGYIESCFKQKFGTPRQPGLVEDARAILKIEPSYQPEFSLQGLNEFSHIWVIFVFHELKDYSFHAKVHPPRMRGEPVGLFATRTPHRPNPLGLSVVRIGKISGQQIELWGGDFVDGAPVIDIKPYLKEIESIPTARSGWAENREHFLTETKVVYLPPAESEIAKIHAAIGGTGDGAQFKRVLEQTLLLDPRPEVYKDLAREHVIRLWQWDVFFTVEPGQITVGRVVKL